MILRFKYNNIKQQYLKINKILNGNKQNVIDTTTPTNKETTDCVDSDYDGCVVFNTRVTIKI